MIFNFFVTGASGWVGQAFLHELQNHISRQNFNDQVKCFGSSHKLITSSNYKNNLDIPIYPLEKMPEIVENYDNIKFFHSAFITREKLDLYGLEKYISKNREIILLLGKSIKKVKNAEAIIISSGAASKYDKKSPCKDDYKNDPYGSLKYFEEKSLSILCNSLVLRIYALSGRFLRDPDVFALGDFIRSAIKKEVITFNSEREVIRGYGFDGDISALAFKWLISDNPKTNKVIATVSDTVNLSELAETITKMYKLNDVKMKINKELESNIYTNNSNLFLETMSKYKLKPTSIENQIRETFKGLENKYSQR